MERAAVDRVADLVAASPPSHPPFKTTPAAARLSRWHPSTEGSPTHRPVTTGYVAWPQKQTFRTAATSQVETLEPHCLRQPRRCPVRQLLQRVVTEVGIDLRSPGLLVAQDLADHKQRRPASNGEARKTVAEIV